MLQQYTLLSILIFIWANNVILTKIALNYITPLHFTLLRLSIGAIAMCLFLIFRRKLYFPTLKDLPFILSIGLLQIGVFQILMSTGVNYVHAGRAAMLVYSTPLWVTPLAILFFQETFTRFKAMGLTLGLTGLFLLFNPMAFDWSDPNILIGNSLLLLASFIWAIVMLHVRYGKWHRSPLDLAPWQLIVSVIPPLLLSPIGISETVQWNYKLMMILLYSGIISSALGMWINTTISKALPVIVTSLALLSVPALSLMLSALFLKEPLTIWNLSATLLITTGIGCLGLENQSSKVFQRKPLPVALKE